MTNIGIRMKNPRYFLLKEDTGKYFLIDKLNPRRLSIYFLGISLFTGYYGIEVKYDTIHDMISQHSEESKNPTISKRAIGGIGALSATFSRRYREWLLINRVEWWVRIVIIMIVLLIFIWIIQKVRKVSKNSIDVQGKKILFIHKFYLNKLDCLQ